MSYPDPQLQRTLVSTRHTAIVTFHSCHALQRPGNPSSFNQGDPVSITLRGSIYAMRNVISPVTVTPTESMRTFAFYEFSMVQSEVTTFRGLTAA